MFLTQPSEDALPKPAAAAGRGRGRPRGPSGASRSSAQPGIAPAAEASRLPESWGRLQNKDERFLADNGDSYEDPDEEGRLHLAGPAPPAPAPGPRGRPAPPSRGRAKAMALISTPPPVGGLSSLRSTGARRRRPGATRRAARASPPRLSGPWAWLRPPASLSSTTVAAVVFAPLRTHVAPSPGLYPAPGPRPPLRFSGPWAPPLPAASLLGPAEPEGGAALAPRRSPHGTLPLQRPPRLSPRPPRRGRP
jgi:hypothetical protein